MIFHHKGQYLSAIFIHLSVAISAFIEAFTGHTSCVQNGVSYRLYSISGQQKTLFEENLLTAASE